MRKVYSAFKLFSKFLHIVQEALITIGEYLNFFSNSGMISYFNYPSTIFMSENFLKFATAKYNNVVDSECIFSIFTFSIRIHGTDSE
jgi:hypothetical protein